MVDESHRRRACTGKAKHETHEAAIRQLNKGKRKPWLQKGAKLVAYKCPYCPYYHIGGGDRD